MKNKILFIFIGLFVLLVGFNKVSATTIYEDENYVIDEEFIYNDLVGNYSDPFDFSTYNQAYCDTTCITDDSSCVSCVFITSNDVLNSTFNTYNFFLNRYFFDYHNNVTEYYYLYYYNGFLNGTSKLTSRVNSTFALLNNSFTSFELPSSDNSSLANYNNDNINTLNFVQYFSPEESEEEQMSILSASTENLSKIIDKATNICEYLFTQELFLMCLSVILFYVVFLIIYKIRR